MSVVVRIKKGPLKLSSSLASVLTPLNAPMQKLLVAITESVKNQKFNKCKVLIHENLQCEPLYPGDGQVIAYALKNNIDNVNTYVNSVRAEYQLPSQKDNVLNGVRQSVK